MGGSKSAKGGPNPLADLDRGVQIRGGSKSAVTPGCTGHSNRNGWCTYLAQVICIF